MVDLGQIVVFSRQPENWYAWHSGGRRLTRQLARRRCLEDRKQRAAKEAYLLPCNRRERPVPKPINIGQRLRRSSPRTILAFENLAKPSAPRVIVDNTPGLVFHPFGEDWRAWIKAANGRSIGKIIKEEGGGVRNLLEGQTLRLHRQLSGHLSIHRRILAIRICLRSTGSQRP